MSEGSKRIVRRNRVGHAKESEGAREGSGRLVRYVRTGREKEAEGPSARSWRFLLFQLFYEKANSLL